MSDIGMPILAIFGVLVAFITIILAMPYFAGLSLISAQDSANLSSTGTSLSASLPLFAILIGGGIALVAIDRGKR